MNINSNKEIKFNVTIPDVFILKNKISVFYYNIKDINLIKFTILDKINVFDNNLCINNFISRMLLEGTTNHTNLDIADIIDFYGADINIKSTPDCNIISFTVLKEYFNDIFQLVCDIITKPLFNEERLQYIKTQEIQKLKIENTKNKTIAFKTFKKELFGEKNNYGYSLNEEDINNVTSKELKEVFLKNWLNNCEIFITGNIDNDFLKYIDSNIPQQISCEGYNKDEKNVILFKEDTGKIINVNNDNSEQVSMCLGKILININDKDYKKLWCTVAFLGGYFGSRLMKNIREKNGYTYGISAQIVANKEITYLLIKTSAKKEFKDKIIEEIFKEINNLQNDDISEEELNSFRQYFLGNILAAFSNIFNNIDNFIKIKILNLDENYYSNLFNEIKNISADDIKQTAKKYLNTEDMTQIFIL